MAKRYQRCNQNPYIEEEQTTHWPKDTKGVIRMRISKKNRQHNGVVCSSLIYWFWLPLWYLLAIVLFVLLWYTDSDYPFGIFWSLCCLFFFDILILTTTLVGSNCSNSFLDWIQYKNLKQNSQLLTESINQGVSRACIAHLIM
jgi:hypothetical protein